MKDFVKKEEKMAEATEKPAKNEQPKSPPPPPPPGGYRVRMIYGGPSSIGNLRHARERDAREARNCSVPKVMVVGTRPQKRPIIDSEVIGFTSEEREEYPKYTRDAIVMTTMIGNSQVFRPMIDNGSVVNVLFLGAFREMRFTKRHLKPCSIPLCGFT